LRILGDVTYFSLEKYAKEMRSIGLRTIESRALADKEANKILMLEYFTVS
jgi:hypothetical protein